MMKKLLALVSIAAFAACSNESVEKPPPEILTFSTSPEAVAAGSQVTFHWTTSNASSVSVAFAGTELFTAEGAEAAAGSRAIAVMLGGVYTLTATGNGTATRDATVTILAPAKVVEFKAAPEAVKAGAETTLSWKTENATEITVRDGATVVFTETDRAKVTEGSHAVAVAAHTEFTLEAKGAGGDDTAAAEVAIIPVAQIVRLELGAPAIREGTSTTLTWQTDHAQSLTLIADAGTGPTTLDLTGKNVAGDSITVSATVETTFELTAHGEGGDAQQSVTLGILPEPTISQFAVAPAQLVRDQQATLSWATKDATEVAIRVGTTPLDLTGKGVNDSLQITPIAAGRFTYVLTASGPGGEATAEAVLEVVDPVPTILTFAADKNETTAGQTVVLSWTTLEATAVSLADGNTPVDLSEKSANDSIILTPAVGSHSYVLTAVGPGGTAHSTELSVTVHPLPEITAFSASKAEAASSENVTLSWTTRNADALVLKDGAKIIDVSGKNVASDSLSLKLTAGRHAFVLVAEGRLGTQAISQTVEVESFDAPKVLTFAASKPEIADGQTVTLSWTTEDATSVTLADGATAIDVTGKTVNDSIILTPAVGTRSYVLTATGIGGTTESTALQVVVHPLPRVTAFAASKSHASTAEQVTLTWTTENASALTLKDGATDVSLAGKPVASGSITLSLTEGSHSFVLTAQGGAESEVSSAPVVVMAHLPPAVTSFAANKPELALGATVTLSWVTANGATWTLNDGATDIDLTGKTGTDSLTLTPALGTHSYVLTVANPGSTVNSSAVTVTVHPQPVISAFAASKTLVSSTETLSLNWTTENANSVTLKDGATAIDLTGKGVASGSITLTLAAGAHSLVLTAHGPGEGQVSSEPLAVRSYDPPQVLTFAANKAEIAENGSVTLTWTSLHGESVSLKDGTTDIDVSTKAGNDSITLQPAVGTHDYVLTVANPAASATSLGVAVVVHPLPAITSFQTDKTEMIAATDTLTFTWAAERAIAVKIMDGTEEISLVGQNPLADTFTTSVPGGVHHFVLVVDGLGGGRVFSAPIAVTSWAPPRILAFRASAPAIAVGNEVTLSWTTDSGTSVSLTDGTSAIPLTGKNPLNDSIALRPALGDWPYQLAATNPAGLTASEVIEVEVMNLPAFTAFDVAPEFVTAGESTTFSWTTTDATDVYGVPYFDGVAMQVVPGSPFEDISSTGTDLVVDKDEAYKTWSFPDGFTFPFFGTRATTVTASSNGWLGIGLTYSSAVYTNASIPNTGAPNSMVAPFWDDLKPGTGGKVVAQLFGTAPNRHAVIQWHKFAFNTGTADLNFQVVLFENGLIELRYATMSGGDSGDLQRSTGTSATVGIENAAGTWGHQIGYNTANIVRSNTSLRLMQRLGEGHGRYVATLPLGTHPLQLTATNPVGAAVTATKTAKVVAAPAITKLAVDRTSAGSGNPIKVSWATTAAATWRLELDGVELANVPQQGQVTDFVINPITGGTLKLHAVNAAGREVTKEVELQVRAPAITEFKVDKVLVVSGATVNFNWKTTNAETLTLTVDSGTVVAAKADPADRTAMAASSVAFTAELGAHVYTLTATNGSGTVSATVNVHSTADVTIGYFTAAPSPVTAGEPVTLKWSALNVDPDLTLSVLGGAAATALPHTTATLTGTLTTTALTEDTVYELVAEGLNGPAIAQATVVVVPRPQVLTFEADSTSVARGDLVTFTWTTSDAQTVALKTDSGAVIARDLPTAGSFQYRATAPVTFVPYATNHLGVTVAGTAVSVAVDVPAPGLVVTASPTKLVRGASSDLTWTATEADSLTVSTAFGTYNSSVLVEYKPLGFIDISATGTKVSVTDNDQVNSFTADPTFVFPYFGKKYSGKFWASNEGWIGLADTYSSSAFSNGDFPNTTVKAQIAPFWDDQQPRLADAGLYWQLTGSAPNRKLIVQWNNWGIFDSASAASVLTYQAILHEDGDIEFQYKSMQGLTANHTGSGATIGLQDDGATAAAIKFAKIGKDFANMVSSGDGFLFHMKPLPDSGTIRVSPRMNQTTTFTATNYSGKITQPVAYEIPVKPGDIIINELMIDPTGEDGLKEWIELRNTTGTAIDLRGFTISATGGSHVIAGPNEITLPANGYLVLAQSSDPAENGGLTPAPGYAYRGDPSEPLAAFSLDNVSDVVQLKIGNTVVNQVAYDAASGWPVQEGRSMQADLTVKSGVTNAFASVWCATAGDTTDVGSPGAANGSCYSWIKATGSFVTLVGDPSATVLTTGASQYQNGLTLPFTFTYFERPFTTVNVSSSGHISLGSASTYSATDQTRNLLPSTSAKTDFLAPYWTAMVVRSGQTGQVLSATRGTAPNRVFIVEWANFYPTGGGTSDSAPVQVHLHENGVIEYWYGNLVGAKSFGQNESIGLQAFGAAGFASSYAFQSTTNVLTANGGLRFVKQ